jgi:hypothetical protein
LLDIKDPPLFIIKLPVGLLVLVSLKVVLVLLMVVITFKAFIT